MIVLLFGAPGCGKGTQAAELANRLEVPSISTGDMFRAECQAGTELGKRAQAILASGGLVGDEIVNQMVASRTAREDCEKGFILDGYPRTVRQAEFLDGMLKQRGLSDPLVVHLVVGEEALVERLTARRYCPQCRSIYNVRSQPPRMDGRCDRDGAALLTREDDHESVIRERLAAYEAATSPVLKWYGSAKTHRIDGAQDAVSVAAAIERVLIKRRKRRPVVAVANSTSVPTGTY